MPRVSIIIPVYNVEKYLEKTVESAAAQTEKDIEIILVDDGSTDRSGKICDEYAKKDPRIKVIHKKNEGLSYTRNAGTAVASGDYVLFLDGDDFLRCDAVERLLEYAERYPSDYVQFRYKEIKDGQDTAEVAEKHDEIFQMHTSEELFRNLYAVGGVAASGCTKLMRRELALEIPFEKILHEDEMWCTRAFGRAKEKPLTVTFIPDELYYYVIHTRSLTHGSFHRGRLDIFTLIKERTAALERLGLSELLHFEYERAFSSVVRLYCEARRAGDFEALKIIESEFLHYKDKIKGYAVLNTKFSILMRLMCLHFGFVYLYYIIKSRTV